MLKGAVLSISVVCIIPLYNSPPNYVMMSLWQTLRDDPIPCQIHRGSLLDLAVNQSAIMMIRS